MDEWSDRRVEYRWRTLRVETTERRHPSAGLRKHMNVEENNVLLGIAIILNGIIGNVDANDLRDLVFTEQRAVQGP